MKWLLAVCGAGLIGASMLAYSYTDDEDLIEYRQYIMETLGEQAAIVGMILEGRAPTDDFALHVEVLAITAATAKKAFEPNVAGGNAKPEVWDQWDDFAKRLDTLSAATRELADAAKAGGVEQAGPMVGDALTCKSCHEIYRVSK
jgi:cytochrome c556